jgi:hypothetical protein
MLFTTTKFRLSPVFQNGRTTKGRVSQLLQMPDKIFGGFPQKLLELIPDIEKYPFGN